MELSQMSLEPAQLFLIVPLFHKAVQGNLREPGHIHKGEHILKERDCQALILQGNFYPLGKVLQDLQFRPFF